MTKFYTAYKWFHIDTTTTLEDVKIEYRKLAVQYHPDLGGDVAIMAAINAEFDEACKLLKGKYRTKSGTVETHEERPDTVGPEFRRIIELLIKCGVPGIKVEIIGTFVWVSGDNCRKIKDDVLKPNGFVWNRNKVAWMLPPEGYVFSGHRIGGMQALRDTFGVEFEAVTGEQTKPVKHA